jgi:hypothetical protein
VIVLKVASTNSRGVGEFPKATILCCPVFPTRLKRIENITESSGSVTPRRVASSHVNAILPVDVNATVVLKLLGAIPGNPYGLGIESKVATAVSH